MLSLNNSEVQEKLNDEPNQCMLMNNIETNYNLAGSLNLKVKLIR